MALKPKATFKSQNNTLEKIYIQEECKLKNVIMKDKEQNNSLKNKDIPFKKLLDSGNFNDAMAFYLVANNEQLKEYKLNPTPDMKQTINDDFDSFSKKVTGYEALDNAIKSFKENKADLLKVLDKPYLPLHNNLSERDIRDYVKKRKISGSTRSEEGRRSRDTFASIKKTCRKLGISFLYYLKDRLRKVGEIPSLRSSVRVAMCRSG